MMMHTRREGDTAVVTVNGKLDMVTVAEFRKTVQDAIAGGAKRAVIDLDGLSYISSAGIGAIAMSANEFKALGGDLRVASPQANVSRVLEICGIDKVVHVHPSVAEALAAGA
jgi:anti-sigma B factor antagonist